MLTFVRRFVPVTALVTLLVAPTAHAQPSSGQGEVELVEPGQGPRRELRHRFAAGQRQRLRVQVQTRMHMAAGARENTVVIPAMVIDLALGPTELTDAGHLRYAFRITGIGAEGGDDRARAQIQEQLGALRNTGGTAEVDERGGIVRFEYELPESVAPEIRQQAQALRSSLSELLPRFPREPVGVGAVWRVRDTLRMPQVEVEMATLYRLRRWEGDRIELQVRIESGDGDLPEGVRIDVGGSGRQRFELGSLEVDGRVQSEADMQMRGPQGEMRIRMQTRSQVRPPE